MAPQRKTPGVYIEEKNAFPNSVVEVATAVPAFIGYTETANRGHTQLTGVPTRITSLAEYELMFGYGPKSLFTMKTENGRTTLTADSASRFLLYYSIRFFFDNGGGPCWIVSIGGYDPSSPKVASAFTGVLPALAKEQEPTMIVAPDAVLLEQADWQTVSNQALLHCTELRSRVAILDIYDGYKERTNADDDVISGTSGFRTAITSDFPSYGMTYYPWVNTSIVESNEVDYTNLDKDSRAALAKEIEDNVKSDAQALKDALDGLKSGPDTDAVKLTRNHQTLILVSPTYKQVMVQLQEAINVLPPSGGIAGLYTRIDNQIGVFKAPANSGLLSVISPTVNISAEQQEDLNVPLDGKAVNAIRTFIGRGVLVWGARTLDGNSQDWRYINVRRTLIMLEQSIKLAADAFVFAANDASTWLTVKNMIDNFLNNQWKSGALAGATPAEAYNVEVGLGSTMTSVDILDGYMRVTVHVAVVRPAEFIVITFQQKMQTS